MFLEYIYILKYSLVVFIVVLLLFSISFLFVYQSMNQEKISSYECGFNPFGDARNKFEVRFYIVAILFIIFDIEIVVLFPWVVTFMVLSNLGLLSMLIFVIVLFVGFFYEWDSGALEWV